MYTYIHTHTHTHRYIYISYSGEKTMPLSKKYFVMMPSTVLL